MRVVERNKTVAISKTSHLRTSFRPPVVLLCAMVALAFQCANAQGLRTDISLNANWRTIVDDQNKNAFNGFEQKSFNDKAWKAVDVPHNWDQYEGYRRLRHGNRHGYASYRKTFTIKKQPGGKRFF